MYIIKVKITRVFRYLNWNYNRKVKFGLVKIVYIDKYNYRVVAIVFFFFCNFSALLRKLLRKSKNMLNKVPTRYDLLPKSGATL